MSILTWQQRELKPGDCPTCAHPLAEHNAEDLATCEEIQAQIDEDERTERAALAAATAADEAHDAAREDDRQGLWL